PEMADRTALKRIEGPGQPGIEHAGPASGIGRDTKMRAGRKDRGEKIRRNEEKLGIDILARLLVVAKKADIVFKKPELHLGDNSARRLRRGTGNRSRTE